MKKHLFFISALLLSVSAFADVVSKPRAEEIAREILGSTSVNYVWNGIGDKKYGDADPAFYVFNGNDAWVIVAAEDCVTPVLMHGEGSFNPENLPDNMRAVLEVIEYNIFEARKFGLSAAPEMKRAWSSSRAVRSTGADPGQVLLETASWNQGAPYYFYCPMDDGKHSVTGCVATAMAILMRYYKWPESGKGTIPGYTTRTKKIVVEAKEIDGFMYDWDNMPLKYINSTINPPVQQEAVARLMEHCGAMVKMDYTATGSGAYSSDVCPAMIKYMSYSVNARELYRSGYSNSEWFRMIKAELDAGHPLIYGGADTGGSGGHQFICDGYNSNNEIHINWGWGGQENAWFAVCYLGPVADQEYNFSLQDSAMFGLVPNTSAFAEPNLETYGSSEISISTGSIASGSFTLKMADFWSRTDYSGELKAALVDRNGTVREFISAEQEVSLTALDRQYNREFECTISETPHVGDYVCIMYSRPDDKWEPVRMYGKTETAGIAAFDFSLINIPLNVNDGYRFYPGVIQGLKKVSSTAWYLDGASMSAGYVTLTTGTHTLKAVVTYSDGSTETIVRKVSVE